MVGKAPSNATVHFIMYKLTSTIVRHHPIISSWSTDIKRNFAQQLDGILGPGRSLMCYGRNIYIRIHDIVLVRPEVFAFVHVRFCLPFFTTSDNTLFFTFPTLRNTDFVGTWTWIWKYSTPVFLCRLILHHVQTLMMITMPTPMMKEKWQHKNGRISKNTTSTTTTGKAS